MTYKVNYKGFDIVAMENKAAFSVKGDKIEFGPFKSEMAAKMAITKYIAKQSNTPIELNRVIVSVLGSRRQREGKFQGRIAGRYRHGFGW